MYGITDFPENTQRGLALVWGNWRVFTCTSEFPYEPDGNPLTAIANRPPRFIHVINII